MPARLLRDWTDSDRFDGITAEAERMFVRLLMKADDYGRFHAEPRRLKAALYPLIENLRQDALIRWLDELSTRQLVFLYESDDHRQLLAIPRFGQRLKQSVPKFPPPPGMPADWRPTEGSSGKSPEVPAVFVFGDGGGDATSPAKPAGGFDAFYAAYPRKVKPKDARKAWDKLKPDDALQSRILSAIGQQRKSPQWQKDGGQFIPYPATWLNAGEWDNQAPELAAPDGSGLTALTAAFNADMDQRAAEATRPPVDLMRRLGRAA
jgi:hypothetical protein